MNLVQWLECQQADSAKKTSRPKTNQDLYDPPFDSITKRDRQQKNGSDVDAGGPGSGRKPGFAEVLEKHGYTRSGKPTNPPHAIYNKGRDEVQIHLPMTSVQKGFSGLDTWQHFSDSAVKFRTGRGPESLDKHLSKQ